MGIHAKIASMEPVLHVGYQKTATTWLQKAVLSHHPGVEVVRRATPDAEWLEDVVGLHPFDFDPGALRARYERSAAACAGRLPFLSYEAWIGTPFSGGRDVVENARRLHAIFPEARVVLVIREPMDMLGSMLRQYVHEGGALPPTALLTRRHPERTYFDPSFLYYDRVIDVYSELFGRDRLCVLLFEMLRSSPQEFVDQLCEFCGVVPLDVSRLEDGHRNTGLSAPSLAIARVANRFVASAFNTAPLVPRALLTSRAIRRALQRGVDPLLFRNARAASPALDAQLRVRLEAGYRAHNQRLAKEHDIPVDRFGYPT